VLCTVSASESADRVSRHSDRSRLGKRWQERRSFPVNSVELREEPNYQPEWWSSSESSISKGLPQKCTAGVGKVEIELKVEDEVEVMGLPRKPKLKSRARTRIRIAAKPKQGRGKSRSRAKPIAGSSRLR